MKRSDHTGKKFGRLTALKFDRYEKGRGSFWEAICDCGVVKKYTANSLVQGHVKSCGCLQKEATSKASKTHGMTKTRLYNTWAHMKARCTCATNNKYADYGGRGIVLCKEWYSFEPFRDWAMSNGYSDLLEIDRIDNDRGYNPENCRFVDRQQNCSNKRTNKRYSFYGEMLTIPEAARKYGVNYRTLKGRVTRYGYTPEQGIEGK